jgi:tetratricopeptide (TPR) repeat protein/precorrin-6B methylase 2
MGRFAASLDLPPRGLATDSDDGARLFENASTLFDARRCSEARVVCLKADALGLRSLEFYLLAGWCCFGVGKLEESENWMRRAVGIAPDAPQSHFNLAVVLQAQQRQEDAATSFERALAQGGVDFDALVGVGSARLALGDLASAEAHFRRALTLNGQRSIGWSLLGSAVGRQCRYPEALEFLARADAIANGDADDATAFTSLAIALTENGRNPEALIVYERNLPRFPIVDGHYAYALALLRAGRLLEGWRHYEFRWLRHDAKTPKQAGLAGPLWSGQALRGKTILIHVEQGFGDVIQFVRYAPQVKALGGTVLLRVARPMKALMKDIGGVDRVLDRDEVIPAYDFYTNLLSLPRILGTTLDTIPAEPSYIQADSTRVQRWRARLPIEGLLRVGLVWAGNPEHPNDRFRSMALSMLRPILEVGGVRFVSLQKGFGAEQATGEVLAGVNWLDVGSELEDFSDTAAVISELDLVLCVDTAVAHLAGALGKPVWVMLPQPADFRWLEGRDDSPWYPTLRLFRQSQRDDWADVVARVKAALEERVREGPAAMPAKTSVKAVTSESLPWTSPAQLKVGHRPGMSAVAETRLGILQYLPDEAMVGDSIGWYGEYLQPQLDLLARLVRPGSTMMEVGAGVGAHAVFLGTLLGEAGHLFLYESGPVLQRILRQNLAVNGVSNVTVMRRTLGSRSEADTAGAAPPTTETLDDLQLERLDWLKVDASGDALDVLAGASDTLWRLRPLLFLAAQDEQTLRELTERAREFSYRCWRMETAWFNAQNFNRRETDIFAGRTVLALLAIPEEIDVDVALDGCVEIS